MGDSGVKETKVKCVQLFLDGSPGYIVPLNTAWDCIQGELETLDDDTVLGLKVKEFTHHQLDTMPEFEGW